VGKATTEQKNRAVAALDIMVPLWRDIPKNKLDVLVRFTLTVIQLGEEFTK
jgi:hypothetical protein